MKDLPLGAFLVMGALAVFTDGCTTRELVIATKVSGHQLLSVLEALEKRGMVVMRLDTGTQRRTVRRYVATPIGIMLYEEEKAAFDKITGKAA